MMADADLELRPVAVRAVPLRAPLERPSRNAFGEMTARPALVVELDLADGATGTGEVFCNWPAFALFHKARIVEDILAPRLNGRTFASPAAMTEALSAAVHRVTLQSGEPGPFAHAIAGLDVAAWDALARRAGLPLWRLLAGGGPAHEVPAYASGLGGEDVEAIVPALREAGWRGYKLKIGFGRERDAADLSRLRALAGPEATLMVDANQAWEPDEAATEAAALAGEGLAWLEEPIAADRSWEEWRRLARKDGPPLALGENLRGLPAFRAAAESGIRILQPDVIKWGGISGAREVARIARDAGIAWAPHYLAGGIGLAATAHLAVACGASWLEFDATENALRAGLLDDAITVEDGLVRLGDRAGHGAALKPIIRERHGA